MSLVKFTSDQGQGYQHAEIWLEADKVVAVVPLTDRYSSTDNRTRISLDTGERFDVRDYVAENAAIVAKGRTPCPS